MKRKLHIVFDGPPAHESGRFVEVEDANGKSVNTINGWEQRSDGLWQLVLTDADLRQSVIEQGSDYSQQFTWEKTTQETLKVYEELLS